MKPSKIVDVLNMMAVVSIIPAGIIIGCLLAPFASIKYQSQKECASSHTEQSIVYITIGNNMMPIVQETKVCDNYKAR